MVDLTLFMRYDMPFTQKVMVIIRWILLISIAGYIFTMNPLYLYGGAMGIILILAGALYTNISGVAAVGRGGLEGFRADNTVLMDPPFSTLGQGNLYLEEPKSNPAPTTLESEAIVNVVTGRPKAGARMIKNPVTLEEVIETDYHPQGWQNPFGNMLLPEIKYDSERKSAPPSFNVDVSEDITRNVKRAVQALNPGIQNTDKPLFGDLYNNFMLDNANRVFYSMPSTRVENDQSAFANFLYHDLVYSGKESTAEGAWARTADNYRYILY